MSDDTNDAVLLGWRMVERPAYRLESVDNSVVVRAPQSGGVLE